MKKLCGAVVILVVLFASRPAIAEESHLWNNFQFLAQFYGGIPVLRDDIAVVGSVMVLRDVASQSTVGFAYLGGRFTLADWYTMHILLAATIDYPAEDAYGFDVSLWHTFRLFDGTLTLFVETDLIFHSEGMIYYGVYAADMHPLDFLSLGLSAEQVDDSVALGPRVGFSLRIFNMQLQYFSTVAGDGAPHMVRFTVGLNF